MDEVKLPEGWEYSQLLKLGTIVTGKTPNTKDVDNFGGNIPFIKPGDLDKGGFITETSDTLTESGLLTVPKLPVNAIVVTCIGNLGKVGITTKTSATNQQINSFICNENLNFKFLYYQICTLKPWLENESSATTIAIVNKGKFSKAPISIPSLAEQKIIADKLDTLLAQVDSTKAHLEKIPQILKHFRLAVLTAAVSGKLTEEWRDINSSEKWETVKLLDIIVAKPRNGYSPKGVEYETAIKNLTLSAVTKGYFIENCFKYVDIDISDDSYLWVKNGDILIQRANSLEYVGVSAIYEGKDNQYIYPDLMMKFRVNERILTKYLHYSLLSEPTREYFRKNASGTTGNMPKINQGTVSAAPVNLPPISEQTEIVRRVEQLFAYADSIEKLVQDALERVNNLTQSILAKAFRGELTAQWRAENPDLISGENSARTLLEKIQQQRTSTKTIKRSKGNS
ncbi:restriction endonuclease subunit S [Klebsiella quasipneumoniae]|uniref:restriction endonuclease subunit S n=1 Tax=Klebsiella quasipneumoniae TaxID=1463165 RepID=UPI002238F891|nr:restriction endonuclease subunit S [Klebsiella quasipneumoniae]MCW4604292.1 restriction endonuclease subunit S [Klebsiella quasipneumoniae]MCW4621734.1 restriction endonuclease subunit S [Klebsiella quasipneumoniae]